MVRRKEKGPRSLVTTARPNFRRQVHKTRLAKNGTRRKSYARNLLFTTDRSGLAQSERLTASLRPSPQVTIATSEPSRR